MASDTVFGVFDGKEAKFTLTESGLAVESDGQGKIEIDVDTIIAITKDDHSDSSVLHLFRSKEQNEWKPKTLCYEKHVAKGLPTQLVQQLRLTDLPQALVPFTEWELNTWVCISTLSGTGDAVEFFDNALHPLFTALKLKGLKILKTSSAESVSEFCRGTILPRANSGLEQTIILLSGDGGPVDMVNALVGGLDPEATTPTLALIPTGTGNALANSSGINNDKTLGVRNMLRGRPRPIPTFQVTLSPGSRFVTNEGQSREPINISGGDSEFPSLYGAVVCSWGFHASLVADSDTVEYRKHGTERFKMAAGELLNPSDGSSPHAYKGKVTVFKESGAEEVIGSQEHAYTLLTHASQLEKGFTISPASQPLDGQLRLVHFGPLTADDTLRLMGLAYQGGKHVEDPSVQYLAVEGMRIDFQEDEERWRRVCIDGKIIAIENGGWIEVQKGRTLLNLIAPS